MSLATSGVSSLGPLVDANVHLWDQRDNPVFWLTDRTLVRDLLGDPATAGFGALVDRLRRIPFVRSVRVRLAGGLAQGDPDDATLRRRRVLAQPKTGCSPSRSGTVANL